MYMKERKTKEDYRLETRIDPKTGKETRVPVYEGLYYLYPVGYRYTKQELLLRLSLLCALWWAAFLAYLFAGTPSTYFMGVLPVVSCSLFPAVYMVLGLFALSRAPLRMTSTQKENAVSRPFHSAVGCMLLAAMACVGDFVMLVRGADFSAEMPGFALLLLLCVLSLAQTRLTRDLASQIKPEKR